jgi:hypothetical protein
MIAKKTMIDKDSGVGLEKIARISNHVIKQKMFNFCYKSLISLIINFLFNIRVHNLKKMMAYGKQHGIPISGLLQIAMVCF